MPQTLRYPLSHGTAMALILGALPVAIVVSRLE